MNADEFRRVYQYHFAVNRKIWHECVMPLTQAQFIQAEAYSMGSVRNQVVHMMNIDDRWFSGLRGADVPGFINPAQWQKRDKIRAKWDEVETAMRAWLATVTDETLATKPFGDEMTVWQILWHVANHGTDHRAQLLRLLNALGVETFAQDYVYFLWGKL
jgi:uncharacterized damage-inducible protein DinB